MKIISRTQYFKTFEDYDKFLDFIGLRGFSRSKKDIDGIYERDKIAGRRYYWNPFIDGEPRDFACRLDIDFNSDSADKLNKVLDEYNNFISTDTNSSGYEKPKQIPKTTH